MNKHSRKINLNYFSSLNLENCYWAGFIAADGCIYLKRQQLIVNIQDRDYPHLLRFVQDIQSNNKIRRYTQFRFNKESHMVVWTATGIPTILEDLKNNFNITERKTLSLSPPKTSDDNLILSYIIGYIDGDGCVGVRKNKYKDTVYKQRFIDIAGTKSILSWINERFNQIFTLKGQRTVRRLNKSRCYGYRIIGNQAQDIFNHLSNLNVPKLKRKWKVEAK